ncbi:MAG: flavodoxin [Ruminococcus sp.]|nr:flavodoxin [Ruminococcus sp.]
MKCLMSIFLTICMVASVALLLPSCSTNEEITSSVSESEEQTHQTKQSETDTTDTTTTTQEKSDDSTNILVVYFSCTETTEQIADWIVTETSADVYEILPKDPYTDEDLDYNNSSSRANQEQADSTARPEISNILDSIDQYDVIFLGYPIWHGQAPRIISTFLESFDCSQKTIIPFCTSHSSGIGSSAENLHSLCADTVVWLDGERFSSDTTADDISDWLDGLNY